MHCGHSAIVIQPNSIATVHPELCPCCPHHLHTRRIPVYFVCSTCSPPTPKLKMSKMKRLQRQLTNCSIVSLPYEAIEPEILVQVRRHFENLHEKQTEWLHERDMQILLRDSRYLSRFVQKSGNNVTQALELTENILKWRMQQSLPVLDYQSFPKEFYERKLMIVHGFDKRGHVLILGRAKLFVKCDEFKEMFNVFYPFLYYEAMHLAISKGDHCGFTVVFDLRDVSVSQFDLSYAVWGIDLLCNRLPSVLRKVILYELPWLCRPLLKACMVFIPEEWRKVIYQCSGKDISKHLVESSLPSQEAIKAMPHLGIPQANGNNSKNFVDFTDDELIKIGLNPSKRSAYLKVLDTIRKIDEKSK